jgi:hypothetical protein
MLYNGCFEGNVTNTRIQLYNSLPNLTEKLDGGRGAAIFQKRS